MFQFTIKARHLRRQICEIKVWILRLKSNIFLEGVRILLRTSQDSKVLSFITLCCRHLLPLMMGADVLLSCLFFICMNHKPVGVKGHRVASSWKAKKKAKGSSGSVCWDSSPLWRNPNGLHTSLASALNSTGCLQLPSLSPCMSLLGVSVNHLSQLGLSRCRQQLSLGSQ